MKDLFEKIDSLTLDKSELYVLGRFCRAFLEKAPVITEELFPFIESSVGCQKFQSKIMRLYTENHENERRQILHEMKDRASHPDVIPFYAPQLDEVNKKLEVKTFPGLLDSIENRLNKYPGLLEVFNNSYKNIHGSEDSGYIRDNYKYYYIGSLLYGNFETVRNRTDILNFKYSSVVFDEYQRIGLDLSKVDNQFLKYNLISLNDNISINNDKDSQTIIDVRIDKYFWINIPRKLLFSIEELIEKKLISEISFRIDYVSESITAMEEMEFGSTLKLEISTLPELSKFYSTENYDNNLWVRHDKENRNLTF